MDGDDRLTVRPEHRAVVTECCLLAAGLTYLSAAAGWPPVRLAVPAVVVAGTAAAAAVQYAAQAWTLAAPVLAWAAVLGCWRIVVAGHPWTVAAVAGLLLPSAALTAWSVIAYAVHHENAAAAGADADLRKLRALAAHYERALAGAGYEGIKVIAAERTRQGHEVTLRLPASGRITMRGLISGADHVATALRLPLGSVAFAEGRHAGDILMSLDETGVLADVVPFPAVSGLMTITKPVPVGIRPGGRPAAVLFREVQVLTTGVTGAGKTNLLNVKIAQFTRCVDAIVWVIDLKGGRLAAPWVRPWVEGRCPAPAVDWVATTRDEAEIMLRALDRVIDGRGSSLAGGSKIRPDPDLPQFIVIADEIADLFGDVPRSEQQAAVSNAILASIGSRVTRKGRSEAVMLDWATQKGTVDFTGSTAIKSQCKLRFSLGTASEADARSVVESTQGTRLLAAADQPGTVLITLPGDRGAELIKVYRLDADDDADRIDELAEAAGYWRPRPDARAAEAMGADYADRWERSELYQTLEAAWRAADRRTVPARVPGPEAEPGTGARRPSAADRSAAVPQPRPDRVDADTARELLASAGLDQDKPDPRNRMYALLAERPNFGLSVIEIDTALRREGLGVHRATIHRWLREDLAAGVVENKHPGTTGSRYKLRRDGSQDVA